MFNLVVKMVKVMDYDKIYLYESKRLVMMIFLYCLIHYHQHQHQHHRCGA